MTKSFDFLEPGELTDDDLELILVKTTCLDPVKKYFPQYEFEMRHPGETEAMGSIRLRVGTAAQLRFPGHIGYVVNEKFRGHRYAARSCILLLPFALDNGLKSVWLTVNPKNIPSQRTCEIIGAKYIETVRIPKDHEMYSYGAYRRRYRLNVRQNISRKVSPIEWSQK